LRGRRRSYRAGRRTGGCRQGRPWRHLARAPPDEDQEQDRQATDRWNCGTALLLMRPWNGWRSCPQIAAAVLAHDGCRLNFFSTERAAPYGRRLHSLLLGLRWLLGGRLLRSGWLAGLLVCWLRTSAGASVFLSGPVTLLGCHWHGEALIGPRHGRVLLLYVSDRRNARVRQAPGAAGLCSRSSSIVQTLCVV
jgi:hypothetical protein